MLQAGEMLTIIAWLAIITASVLAIISVIYRRRKAQAERRQAAAQIVSMERRVQPHRTSNYVEVQCFAIFRLMEGQEMAFRIPEVEYARLSEGDTGELTWQGTRYLFFSRFF